MKVVVITPKLVLLESPELDSADPGSFHHGLKWPQHLWTACSLLGLLFLPFPWVSCLTVSGPSGSSHRVQLCPFQLVSACLQIFRVDPVTALMGLSGSAAFTSKHLG